MDREWMEKFVLGYFVRGEKLDYQSLFSPEMFTGFHRDVFEMIRDGKSKEEIAMKFGHTKIADMMCLAMDYALTSVMVDEFLTLVGNDSLRDELLRKSQEVGTKPRSEIIGNLKETFTEIATTRKRNHVLEYEELEKVMGDNVDGVVGIRTGYETLDKQTSGLVAGQTWVVGGYSGYGKSFFAQNVMNNLLEQSPTRRVMVISTEMVGTAYMKRLVGLRAGIDTRLVLGTLKGDEHERRLLASEEIKSALEDGHFVIDDLSRTTSQITSAIRNEHDHRKLDLVIVDFIQQVSGEAGRSKYEVLQEFTNAIQSLAIELKTTVMMLSQISNEAQRNKEMSTYGYKGAGEIGEVADVGILIQREKNSQQQYTPWFGVVLQKSRYGETGIVNLEITFPGGKLKQGKPRESYQ